MDAHEQVLERAEKWARWQRHRRWFQTWDRELPEVEEKFGFTFQEFKDVVEAVGEEQNRYKTTGEGEDEFLALFDRFESMKGDAMAMLVETHERVTEIEGELI